MKRSKAKQIAAIAAIVIIVAIYIVTLILAITNNEQTRQWFMAAIIATIVVPVMAYVYIWIYKKVKGAREDAVNDGFVDSKETDEK